MEIELRMYETPDGRCPFSEWMDRIDGNPAYEQVMKRLERVERGAFGDHKFVGEGVVELRIEFGPRYRIYVGRDGLELIILLVGGDKGSQHSDIKRAKEYWGHYHA